MPFISVDLPEPLAPTTAVSEPLCDRAAQMVHGRMAAVAKRQVAKGQAGVGHSAIRGGVFGLLVVAEWICDVINIRRSVLDDAATSGNPHSRLGETCGRWASETPSQHTFGGWKWPRSGSTWRSSERALPARDWLPMSPGHSVALIEQENRPGYHSTGRSAAIFIQNYGNAGDQRAEQGECAAV